MKKKKLYQIPTILVLVIIFSMALLYMGCKVHTEPDLPMGMSEQDKKAEAEAAEEAALLEETKVKAAEYEAAKKAEEEAAPEEENLIPNEPITYSGNLYNANGTEVILIVNFKTTEVTGPISLDSVDDYIDATINGKIDIDTFEVTSNYYGIWRLKETDEEFPFNGTITGKITEDLSTFNGIIHPDYSDVGVEFTATK